MEQVTNEKKILEILMKQNLNRKIARLLSIKLFCNLPILFLRFSIMSHMRVTLIDREVVANCGKKIKDKKREEYFLYINKLITLQKRVEVLMR